MTPDEQALKIAIYQTIRANGGVEAAGSLVGMSAKSMSRFQSDQHPECSPSLFTAVQLDERGNGHILRCWAERTGQKLTPLKAKPKGKSISQILGTLSKEHGDVMRAALEANADGDFSPREAVEVLKQADEEIEVLNTLRGLCLATIQNGAK
ncbi:MAG: phage regulatory CII family protein [Hyphomicrobiales bacterium]